MTILAILLLASCGGGSDVTGDTGADPGTDPGTDLSDLVGDPADDPVEDPVADPAADPGAETGEDPATDPGAGGVVGDPCTSSSDCSGVPEAPNCLTVIPMGSRYFEFPGGYCSGDCADSDDCGAGAECVRFFGGMRVCMKSCTADSECRESEGYGCREHPVDGGTFCMPPRPPRPDADADALEDAAADGAPSDVPAG
jgi:hypothetical protein